MNNKRYIYTPTISDALFPKVSIGKPIPAGSVVTITKHFVHPLQKRYEVEDAQGNRQEVSVKALRELSN